MTTQAFAMQEISDFIFQYSDGAQGHMIYKTTMKKLNNEFNCILPFTGRRQIEQWNANFLHEAHCGPEKYCWQNEHFITKSRKKTTYINITRK